MKFLLCPLLLLVLMTPARLMADDSQPPRQQALQFQPTAAEGESKPAAMQYLLYLPKDYDAREKWPLMLFLHGAGERGDDLEAVKKHGPPKLIEAGREYPMIVVSPQVRTNHRWEAESLTQLLDALSKQHRVDQDRIYVTGLSMGGYGSWDLAARIPQRLAAIVPICGGGDPETADAIKHLPIWAFHGDADKAVPVERSQTMIDAVKAAGGEPKLTIYPGVEHDSWTVTYANDELYEWLLQQRRGKR